MKPLDRFSDTLTNWFTKANKKIAEWTKKNSGATESKFPTNLTISLTGLFTVVVVSLKFLDYLHSKEVTYWIIIILIAVLVVILTFFWQKKKKTEFSPGNAIWTTLFIAVVIIVLQFVLIPFIFWPQSFFEPEKRDNWGFTREEYNAQYTQPSNGSEGVFVPVPPPTRSGSTNASKYPITSFREEHQKKAGEIFYIKLDNVGFLFVPEEEGVWYTVTMRNTDYPNQFSTFTLKREGNTLYVKDRKRSEERYKGIWSVTLSRDMTFAFRSQSDTRVHIVEE